MKSILIAFILLLVCQQTGFARVEKLQSTPITEAKRADSLANITSAKEIEGLLIEHDSSYKDFRVNDDLKFQDYGPRKIRGSAKRLADSLNLKPWTKTDFDGNGLTDLLVIGSWSHDEVVLCVMNDNGDMHVKWLAGDFFHERILSIVDTIEAQIVIVNYYTQLMFRPGDSLASILRVDTLAFKFGGFVEYNSQPQKSQIDSISFTTTACFGTCPIFELMIHSDLAASYVAREYNDRTGVFSSHIESFVYDSLVGLLNYSKFADLDSSYSVNATDHPTCYLTIWYNNGLQKKIRDYGLQGTYGLRRTYEMLFALRDNLDWR